MRRYLLTGTLAKIAWCLLWGHKPQAWSPGQVVFLRCNFQQVQSSQDGRGAKTKEWERGVWQGEKTTAVVRESASRQPGLLVHASLVVRPRRRGRVVWLPDQGGEHSAVYRRWVGGPMSLKGGNFSFQARTAQNRLRMGKYGTYLE